MKIKVILESQLFELDHDYRRDDPRDDYRDYDYEDDKLENFLEIKWQEDYISVYDALDGFLGDSNWAEKVNSWFESDIEDLKLNEKNLNDFREMAVGSTGGNRSDIKQAVDKYVVADDFRSWRKTDDVEHYIDLYGDQLERGRYR